MFKLAVVVQEGDKWLVKTKDESRTLVTHDTAKDAYAQLYAIEKSKERESKKASSWAQRYAIANEQEFDKAMGDQNKSMSRSFMDHFSNMYNRHLHAISQLEQEARINPYDSIVDRAHKCIDKHKTCATLIDNIMGMHMDGQDSGDHEDQYNAVAKDAFHESNRILHL